MGKRQAEAVLEDPEMARSPKAVHLIRSTYRVIGEKGVHGLSLQDVADVAEVSKGIILYHFKTKENLLLETMRWVLLRVAGRINDSLATARTPAEQVPAMIDAIFRAPSANRRFYITYLDLVDYAVRRDTFNELSATFDTIVNRLYADVIRAGVAQGSFRSDDVGEGAQIVRAIIDGLFIQWLQDPKWERSHEHYKNVCKRAVLAYLHAGDGTESV